MIYALLVIAAFSTGFGVAYKIDSATINELKHQIEASNDQAASTLTSIQERVAEAHATAKAANTNLELAHAQSINTINAYHDAVKSKRLHDPHRKNSGCPLSADTNTGLAFSSTETSELSAALTDFLIAESFSADQIGAYAQQCYAYVNNNCGLNNEAR